MPRSCRTPNVVLRLSSITRHAKARSLSALVGGVLVCACAFAPSAFAATPAVNLGQASGYALISGASVTQHRGVDGPRRYRRAHDTDGFSTSMLDGTMRVGSADATAYNDFLAAYNEVQNRPAGTALPALAGATLTPGLYSSGAAAGLAASTSVTLDAGGDPSAVFVIQVNGALALGAGAQVKLTGDAQASNVFWAVNGAFSIGANGQFAGTVLASTAGDVGAGSLVNGRVFAETAVTTNHNQFYSAAPTLVLTGGGSLDSNNSAPTINGTTNVGTGVVTVTVAGQTLTAPGSVRWNVVGDPDDIGQRQLLRSGLDRRRGGQRGQRRSAADD